MGQSHHDHDTNERFTTAATDQFSTLFNERERGGQGKDFEQRILVIKKLLTLLKEN